MKNEVPPFMNKGSRGPHVTVLHILLFGMGKGEGIVMDGDYGSVTAEKVAKFQQDMGLDHDGNFGPITREELKCFFDFDFEAACQTIPGTTSFVQPDGTVIEWGPTAEEVAS